MHNANRLTFFLVLGIVLLGLLWVAFAQLVVPPLIESARQLRKPVEIYLREWNKVSWNILLTVLVAGLVLVLETRPWFQRFVPARLNILHPNALAPEFSLSKYLVRRVTLIWFIFLLVTLATGLWNLSSTTGKGKVIHGVGHGLLFVSVAQALADGHGFSQPSNNRWMFSRYEGLRRTDVVGEYFPTAMKEPIYLIMMAISFKALGGSSLFCVDDIIDWPGFLSRLNTAKKADQPSPGKRIWTLLTPPIQALVEKSASGVIIQEEDKSKVIDELNGILHRRDFYQEPDFSSLALKLKRGSPGFLLLRKHGLEFEHLLERNRKGLYLSPVDVQRLNRLLIEAAYPHEIAMRPLGRDNYGQLVILVFQVVVLFLTSIVLYYLGRMVFNAQTGMLAGVILAILPNTRWIAESYIGPAALVGLMVSISACLILWCLDKVSVRRGIVLGAVLGFSCLTLSSVLFFIPVAVLLVLVSVRPFRPVVWKTALAIVVTACVVVSPWTIRNLVLFGKFVPVRVGFGLAMHQGNPILAATFTPGLYACSETLGPLWKAPNAHEAIQLQRKKLKLHSAITGQSQACMQLEAPEGYESFNEAERDKVYFQKTVDFIRSEPQTFAILTYSKALDFFYTAWDIDRRVITLFALIGALITWRNPRARVLILLALAYSVPYWLALPLNYRYRYPMEPLLIVLSCYIFTLVASKFNNLLRKLIGRSE